MGWSNKFEKPYIVVGAKIKAYKMNTNNLTFISFNARFTLAQVTWRGGIYMPSMRPAQNIWDNFKLPLSVGLDIYYHAFVIGRHKCHGYFEACYPPLVVRDNGSNFKLLASTYAIWSDPFLSTGLNLVCHPCGRDAVALLLQNKEAMVDEKNVGTNTPWLIDLRRHDERALYGHIKGSMHIRGVNGALY